MEIVRNVNFMETLSIFSQNTRGKVNRWKSLQTEKTKSVTTFGMTLQMRWMVDKFAYCQTGTSFTASRILPSIICWTEHEADMQLG